MDGACLISLARPLKSVLRRYTTHGGLRKKRASSRSFTAAPSFRQFPGSISSHDSHFPCSDEMIHT